MAGKNESLYYYREESQYYGKGGEPAPKLPQNPDDSQYYDENSQYYDENSQYYDENSKYYDDRDNRDSQYYRDGDDSRYYDDKNDSRYDDDRYYDENSQYYDEKDSRYYDDPPRRDTKNTSQPRDSVSEFNAYYDDDDYDNPRDPPRGSSTRDDYRDRDSRYDDSYRDSRYDDSYRDSRYDDSYRDSRYDDSYRDSRYDDSYRDSRYDDTYRDSRYDDSYRDSRYDDTYRDDSRYDDSYRDSRYDNNYDDKYDDKNKPPPSNQDSQMPPPRYNDRDASGNNTSPNLNKMMNNLNIDSKDENICYSCGNPIKGKAHPKNGHVYCAKDYVMLFAPKCKKCQKPIKGETVCALGAKYHKACFSCITCDKPFPDKSFYVFNNNPVCRRHYHQLNNSLCTKCDEPIEGPCAEVIEGRFHPNCFVCCICFTPLTGLYYNFQGEAYCETDIMKIHKEKINKANKRRTIMSFIE